jgi:TRAP-type C4-dicarboxylate transport system substrate-binding protein
MKRRILSVALTTLFVAGILLVHLNTLQAAPAGPSPANPIQLKFVTFLPKNDLRVATFLDFLKLVEQKSKGAITYRFLGGQEVIAGSELANNLKLGTVDIAMLPGAFFEGQMPGASMISLSQISSEEERKRGVWDKLAEMGVPAGLRPVGRFMPQNDPLIYVGFRKIKPTSLKDLVGLKLGYSGRVTKAWAEALGMTFVQVPNPEFYTAMERGVIDAISVPILDHSVYALYEVEKTIVDHPFYVSNGYILMSLKAWNSLSKSLQDSIQEAYLAWEPQTIKMQRESEAKTRQQMTSKKPDLFTKLPPADAAKYVQTAYDAEWDRLMKTKPDLVKVLRPLLSK